MEERFRRHALELSDSLFYAAVLLSPAYLVRFPVFGVPTNALDALLFASILLRFPGVPGLNGAVGALLKERKAIFAGIALIIIGLLLGLWSFPSVASIGIIKSWFILPIVSATLFFASANGVKKRLLVDMTMANGVLVALVASGYLLVQDLTYDGRLRAFYESPNHLAMTLAPAAVIIWFVHFRGILTRLIRIRERKSVRDLAAIALGALFILALYGTRSYGAWGAVLVSILLGETALMRKCLRHGARTVLFACLAGLILLLSQAGTEKMLGLFDDRSSLSSREMIWRSAWRIGLDNWFVGIGAGNFQQKYLEYQQFFSPYLEWAVPQPHNLFFAFWLQTGLMGTVGLVTLLVSLIMRATALLREKQSEDAIKVKIAVVSAILCVIIHGLIDTTIWKNDLGLVWWVLALLV
jgi:O-antigen ligase